jgi:hypothetical protein
MDFPCLRWWALFDLEIRDNGTDFAIVLFSTTSALSCHVWIGDWTHVKMRSFESFKLTRRPRDLLDQFEFKGTRFTHRSLLSC